MQIQLQQIGKRYNQHVIFRNVNLDFLLPHTYALLGNNGSGKSTLLQIVGGFLIPSFGAVEYQQNKKIIKAENIYQYVSICAPSLQLIEEFSVAEFLQFHFSHKKPMLDIQEMIAYIGMQQAADTLLENCSSGMKQRVKLAQSIFADTPILLLDEPCTNLDADGYALYKKMIAEFTTNKLVIVSSNDVEEYNFCQTQIQVTQFK
jgi:ABC-type multidrug transport system ATPase subunit